MVDALAMADTMAPAAQAAKVAHYVDQAKAPNTRRAYRSDWRDFEAWCVGRAVAPLPASASTVVSYLVHLAEQGYKTATMQRRLTSIALAHEVAGHESPTHDRTVRVVWAGIRRVHGTAQDGVAPIMPGDLRAMLRTLDRETAIGRRDAGLLLLGFAGAFRRSELVALDLDDIREAEAGLIVTIRRSKTDQEGKGRQVGVPWGAHAETCPVGAVLDWMERLPRDSGSHPDNVSMRPLFRPVSRWGVIGEGRLSDKAVARVIKQAAGAAGLDASRFSGHSLRAGLASSAAAVGSSEAAIARTTGHRSMAILRRYVRHGEVFRDSPLRDIGL